MEVTFCLFPATHRAAGRQQNMCFMCFNDDRVFCTNPREGTQVGGTALNSLHQGFGVVLNSVGAEQFLVEGFCCCFASVFFFALTALTFCSQVCSVQEPLMNGQS